MLSTSEGDRRGAGLGSAARRASPCVDDEPRYLTLATAATSVDEGSSVTFTLTREGPVDEPLAVPGPLLRSYHSGQSFLAPYREHPVTFAPGSDTATFTVTPEDDEVFSVQRHLYVEFLTEFQGMRGGFRLRVPESPVLLQQSNEIITLYRLPVRDNDQVRVSITPRTPAVDEGQPACVTVASDAVFPAYRQSEIAVTVAVSQEGDYLADYLAGRGGLDQPHRDPVDALAGAGAVPGPRRRRTRTRPPARSPSRWSRTRTPGWSPSSTPPPPSSCTTTTCRS